MKFWLVDYFPVISSVIFITFLFSSMDSKQQSLAQRLDKIELIRDDIVEIKIKVERIDERLNNKKRD